MVCLVYLPLVGLRRLHLACSLAELASVITRTDYAWFAWFVKTALGSLAREARFARADYAWFAWFAKTAPGSLSNLALLAQTIFGLLVLRRPRLTWSPIWTILYLLGLPDLRDLRGLCQTRSLARLKLRIFLKRNPAKKIFKKKSSQKIQKNYF